MGRGGSGRGMGQGCGWGRRMGTGRVPNPVPALVVTTPATDMKASRAAPAGSNSLRMPAVVDRDRCVSCGICADICPEHAISMDGLVVIDPTRCTGCGSCIDDCPTQALSIGEQIPTAPRGCTG